MSIEFKTMGWSTFAADVLVPALMFALPITALIGFVALSIWFVRFFYLRASVVPYLSVPLAITLLLVSWYVFFVWEFKEGESHGANLAAPFVALPILAGGLISFVLGVGLFVGAVPLPQRLRNNPTPIRLSLLLGVLLTVGSLVLDFAAPSIPWYPVRLFLINVALFAKGLAPLIFVLSFVLFAWQALEKKRTKAIPPK